MSLISSLSGSGVKKDKSDIVWALGLILLGMSLSVAIAHLVVNGQWHFALGLIVAIPTGILLHQYPFLSLIVWLFLTPFLVSTDSGSIRKVYWIIHRALPLATLGVIILSSLFRAHRFKLPKLGWAEAAMAGYVIVSVLSILYLNDDVKATLIHYYDRILIPMCLYLLVRLLHPGEKAMRWLVPVLTFIVISQSIIGLLSWIAPQLLPSPWLGRAGTRTEGSFSAYSVFTSTMAFCGLFILHAAINEKLKIRRIWYVSLFSLTILMIFFSFSRGSWLAGVLIILGLICLYPKFMLRYSIIVIPVIMLILSGGYMSDHLNWARQRFYSEQSKEAAGSRLPIYYASYRMFEAKPLFGWGFGNFDRYDRQFQTGIGEFTAQKDHASHNVYLTLIAEQGIIGFSLFILPAFWWLVQTLKGWSNIPRHDFINRNLIFVFWLVILFHFVVNNFSNMRVVFGLGMWWITLGLIASTVNSYRTSTGTLERPVLAKSNNTLKTVKVCE